MFNSNDIFGLLFCLSILTALLIQIKISRLYLHIVHDVPLETVKFLFLHLYMIPKDIANVGFEQFMVSYIPFNGVIEREYRTPEKADKIKERGRLCILFFVFTFGALIVTEILDWLGFIHSEPYHETFSSFQSFSIGLWG